MRNTTCLTANNAPAYQKSCHIFSLFCHITVDGHRRRYVLTDWALEQFLTDCYGRWEMSLNNCVQSKPNSLIWTDTNPIKFHLFYHITVDDHRRRRVFTEWALEQFVPNPYFHYKIIVSDGKRL